MKVYIYNKTVLYATKIDFYSYLYVLVYTYIYLYIYSCIHAAKRCSFCVLYHSSLFRSLSVLLPADVRFFGLLVSHTYARTTDSARGAPHVVTVFFGGRGAACNIFGIDIYMGQKKKRCNVTATMKGSLRTRVHYIITIILLLYVTRRRWRIYLILYRHPPANPFFSFLFFFWPCKTLSIFVRRNRRLYTRQCRFVRISIQKSTPAITRTPKVCLIHIIKKWYKYRYNVSNAILAFFCLYIEYYE